MYMNKDCKWHFFFNKSLLTPLDFLLQGHGLDSPSQQMFSRLRSVRWANNLRRIRQSMWSRASSGTSLSFKLSSTLTSSFNFIDLSYSYLFWTDYFLFFFNPTHIFFKYPFNTCTWFMAHVPLFINILPKLFSHWLLN